MPACELTVTAKAGSVILTVVATDTSRSQVVELAAMEIHRIVRALATALGASRTDAMPSTLVVPSSHL